MIGPSARQQRVKLATARFVSRCNSVASPISARLTGPNARFWLVFFSFIRARAPLPRFLNRLLVTLHPHAHSAWPMSQRMSIATFALPSTSGSSSSPLRLDHADDLTYSVVLRWESLLRPLKVGPLPPIPPRRRATLAHRPTLQTLKSFRPKRVRIWISPRCFLPWRTAGTDTSSGRGSPSDARRPPSSWHRRARGPVRCVDLPRSRLGR